jgi:hypothetical protein
MNFQDLTQLLEQDESIFKPRQIKDRHARYKQQQLRQIYDYVKNGSEGTLNLMKMPDVPLPKNLQIVRGNLLLDYSKITELPDGLKVLNELSIQFTKITELPDNLYVGETTYAFGAELKTIPSTAYLGKSVYLSQTKIEELPQTAHSYNNLFFNGGLIRSLPSKLVVRNLLQLDYTPIERLPRDIICHRVSIVGTPLAKKYTVSELKQMHPKVDKWITS